MSKCPVCGFNLPNTFQIEGGKASNKKRFAGKTPEQIKEIMRKMSKGEKLS